MPRYVGHDEETLTVGNQLGGRHERVLLEEPCDHLAFFRPFVQGNVSVPHELRGRSCERFAYAPAEGVVCERHFLSVGAHDAGEHAVALPVVTPARAVGAETDAKLCFEPLLINGGDDAAAQRHFLELLEHEVALAVVVVEMFAVFRQAARWRHTCGRPSHTTRRGCPCGRARGRGVPPRRRVRTRPR